MLLLLKSLLLLPLNPLASFAAVQGCATVVSAANTFLTLEWRAFTVLSFANQFSS